MAWSWSRRALRSAGRVLGVAGVAAGAALALAGCNPDSGPNVAAVDTRGATVAFDSIDGLPQGQFHTLVQDLNSEAQTRRLAIASREQPSAYRVRGYLAATVGPRRQDHHLLGLGRVRPQSAAGPAHQRQ